ncbi:hypothetical protein G3R49_10415 [Shewanella sp. WXL01]|uniref:Uncharacterized protein n=1 Tax=Shewanella maritima TaxID=2520507 RepID=A0A411PKD1_9GAMM|nr:MULTISPECIES: hypothetical protein [Shewanella]NKF50975.1 hypothetical protein [Shewanella sp. WXL01]QBF83940.1 hypothetical protein EXU30_15560 [Shewanella maritima]
MIAKPIYESLPLTYLIIGGAGIVTAQPIYALAAAVVVYLFGGYIYNQRSANRRTDPKRKRKQGFIPEFLYGQLPFLYILAAGLLTRFYPRDSSTLFSICLVTFGFYLIMRRASFRHHKIPASSFR